MVLTSYPTPEEHRGTKGVLNAVGWHSERLIKELSKTRRVLVVAEKDTDTSESLVNKNTLIKRIWKKGSLPSFIRLAQFMYAQKQIKSVLVQFEFNVFGGILPNLYLLLLILFLRILGKRVTFEFHQVILDIKLLQKHIQITNPWIQKFYNLSLKMYYFAAGLLVNNIIVFEVELKDRLKTFVAEDKIYVLSLAVEKKPTISKNIARKKANLHIKKGYGKIHKNDFVLLVFGFINGYKGIDWITDKLKTVTDKNVRLLVVGGKNPYLAHKSSYQKFYNGIVAELKKHKHMSYVDFVPEEDIPLYFNAADAAVIPYEVFMAASGPFSHALSYKKPLLLSEHLKKYVASPDIKTAMKDSGTTDSDLIFTYTKKDLLRAVTGLSKNPQTYAKMTKFSALLGKSRSMENVSQRLNTILFQNLYTPRVSKPSVVANPVFTK